MKTINGKHWFQVKDLILHLEDMPKESIISVGITSNLEFKCSTKFFPINPSEPKTTTRN